jgi:hypothetical protein
MKVGVPASIVAALILALTIAPAANADDGAPNVTTPPVVTAPADPSSDPAPAAAPVADPPSSDAPSSDAPAAPESDAPAPQAKVAESSNLQSKSTPKKVFVCKYTGKPGVDEQLKGGKNPISVSISAIDHNKWDGTIPGYFSDAQDRSYVTAYDTGQTPPACPAPVGPPTVQKEVGLYIYPLLDATKAPSWSNSGTQIFCESKDGDAWFTTLSCTLPPKVCGTGWGYQQDKVKNWGYTGNFNWPASIQYPTDNIGWPPIYDAKHGLLSELTTVPDCTPPPPTDVCKNIAGDQATVPAGFTQSGENCVPVPTECTTSTVNASVWTTEDGAPTVGTDGIDFSTPDVTSKVNWFGRTLNVPFAGISGGSYTVKNTGGPIAAYDFEVWQTGTSSFATVVFEPYVNGLTGTGTSGDGTFHTYTITPDSLVWNSKIASGEGSQAQPVTLTRMQELIPSATLIRAGLGQGKGNAGSLSTVSSFTDPACGYTEFPKLPPVQTMHPENVMFHDSCGVTDDSYTVPGTIDDTPSVFNDPVTGDVTTYSSYSSEQGGYTVVDTTTKAGVRTVQVTFVQIGAATIAEPGADDTYVIVTIEGHKYAQWTYTYDSTPCPLTIIATPPAPVVNPATCTADGSLPALKDGEGYTAAYNRPFNGPGAYTAVYTAVNGATFKDGTTVSYDLTVAAKQVSGCPTTTTTGGANTGLNGGQPGINTSFWNAGNTALFGGGAALLTLAALLGALALIRVKRIQSKGEAGVEAQ